MPVQDAPRREMFRGGAKSRHIRIITRQTSAFTAHAIDGPDHPGFRRKIVQIGYDLLFIGNRDIESPQFGLRFQQSGQLLDRFQFVKVVPAIRNAFACEFIGEIPG